MEREREGGEERKSVFHLMGRESAADFAAMHVGEEVQHLLLYNNEMAKNKP